MNQRARHHVLDTAPENLHGYFSCELEPVLTIRSGETVTLTIPDAHWRQDTPNPQGIPTPRPVPHSMEHDQGHCLVGPIAVANAQPGQTLAIDIGRILPGGWGWTAAGGWASPVNKRLRIDGNPTTILRWQLDPARGIGIDQHGREINLAPFLGVLGMPPAETGRHSTSLPRPCGGNLDCRELVCGSTLFLPVSVPDAYVSCGDGHAAQGDGEVAGTALECAIEAVDLTFRLLDDMPLRMPLARTPAGWLTMGIDDELETAMNIAANEMISLIGRRYRINRKEAAALGSIAASLRITQIVNGTYGVHAILPHGAIRTAAD